LTVVRLKPHNNNMNRFLTRSKTWTNSQRLGSF